MRTELQRSAQKLIRMRVSVIPDSHVLRFSDNHALIRFYLSEQSNVFPIDADFLC